MKPTRAILLLAAVLFLVNLWGYDLWAPDEPYFGEGAREMLVDGEWAVPHVNGVVTTDKPPLFFWLIALLSMPLGAVTEWTARLPSVLAALGTVALTMRLARRADGERAAALVGLVLCTAYMFWEKARWSQIDATLCFLIWVALSAFDAFRAGDAGGRRAGVLFWSAAALAVLAKGPVGVLLPLAIAVLTLAGDQRPGTWRRFAPFAGPAAFFGIVGAWALLATLGGGGEYSVWGAFREHFLERGLRGMHHAQPWWYFLKVLPVYLLPWTGLLPGALLLAWRRRDPTDRLALTAVAFVVVFFSVSTEKRELYALPAFPAFALLCGRFAAHLSGERPLRVGPRWAQVGQAIAGGTLVAAGVVLPFAARRVDAVPDGIAWTLSVLLFATGVATLAAIVGRRLGAAVILPGAGLAVTYLAVAYLLYPALNPMKSGRPFGERIREVTRPAWTAGEPILAFELSNLPETFAFYSGGVYTVETVDLDALVAHFDRASDRSVFAVIHAPALDRLPDALRRRLHVIDRTHLGRRDVLLVEKGSSLGLTP